MWCLHLFQRPPHRPLLCGTRSFWTIFPPVLIPSVQLDGFTTGASLPDAFTDATGSSITNRRDIGIFRDATATGTEPVDAGVTIDQQFVFNQATSGGSVNFGFMIQNDYDTAISGANGNAFTNGLGLTSNGVIASGFYTYYVMDLDASSDPGYAVTFTVFGATNDDYARATKTTSGGAELLEFSMKDFQGDLNGDFATTAVGGKGGFVGWTDVTAFGYNVDSTGAGGSFVLNEVYATIPEPGSMLAFAGLFGGVGIVRFRRRRAARKTA